MTRTSARTAFLATARANAMLRNVSSDRARAAPSDHPAPSVLPLAAEVEVEAAVVEAVEAVVVVVVAAAVSPEVVVEAVSPVAVAVVAEAVVSPGVVAAA